MSEAGNTESPLQLEQRLRAQMAEALPEIIEALKRKARTGNADGKTPAQPLPTQGTIDYRGVQMSIRRRPPAAGIGRKKGVPNKFTAAAKEMFELCHQDIGGREAMAAWARKHRTVFYTLFARLIPLSVNVANTFKVLSYAERMSQEQSATAPGADTTVPERTVQ